MIVGKEVKGRIRTVTNNCGYQIVIIVVKGEDVLDLSDICKNVKVVVGEGEKKLSAEQKIVRSLRGLAEDLERLFK